MAVQSSDRYRSSRLPMSRWPTFALCSFSRSAYFSFFLSFSLSLSFSRKIFIAFYSTREYISSFKTNLLIDLYFIVFALFSLIAFGVIELLQTSTFARISRVINTRLFFIRNHCKRT